MARIFVYDGRRHPDPDPAATEEEIRSLMTQWYPDIANATIERETEGTDSLVIFRRRVGNKGGYSPAQLAERVLETPPKSLALIEEYGRLRSAGNDEDQTLRCMASGDLQEQLLELERYSARASDAYRMIERACR